MLTGLPTCTTLLDGAALLRFASLLAGSVVSC